MGVIYTKMCDPLSQSYGKYLCKVRNIFDFSTTEEMELYWDCFYCPVSRTKYDSFEDYKNSCCFHKTDAWCYLEDGGYLVMIPGDLEVISWEKKENV